jgi:hypothetical protein
MRGRQIARKHVAYEAKLIGVARSMLDFAALMAAAQKQSSALVALDCASIGMPVR